LSGIPKFWSVISAVALLPMSAASSAEQVPSISALKDAANRCKQLTSEGDISGLIIQSTRHVTQEIKQTGPSYCEVVAKDVSKKGSSIGMIFRFPDRWNGKILGLGGGGFAGTLRYSLRYQGSTAAMRPFRTTRAITQPCRGIHHGQKMRMVRPTLLD